jgi:hypothetical protein
MTHLFGCVAVIGDPIATEQETTNFPLTGVQ